MRGVRVHSEAQRLLFEQVRVMSFWSRADVGFGRPASRSALERISVCLPGFRSHLDRLTGRWWLSGEPWQ